ncbi:MAG TPA: NAD(P)H-binding protein [Rhizomicrobium sp.]|jgi:nucleoside-diphosphate-sugar epimerase
MTSTALVLGATGGIGGEMARLLVARGWSVRALNRNPAKAPRTDGITWIKGDAMSARDVAAAAKGVAVIVHAVNPPGYRNWGKLVLPMVDNTIAAAKANGARIVLPGTVYNYGPDVFPNIAEDAPQNARTRKGRIRVEMERRLRKASTEGAKVLIVRAGDYFGPRAANNWFAQMVTPGRAVKSISNPGRRGVGHQWAYLPDVAETMMRLLEKGDALEDFATFHMNGHWDDNGEQMVQSIRRVTAKPKLKMRRFPWPLIVLGSPFVALFRELREMRYLWKVPVHITNARLVSVLGEEPHTPLDEAVRTTLEGLGCLS